MDSKESLIKEKRTIEATRKNLMGPSGKLGIICRFLGKPIIFHGGANSSELLWDDPYEMTEDEELPTFNEEEGGMYVHGWVYDGLSRGMHLEIKYIDHEKKLTVFYKGFEVFKEIAGDLEKYAPFSDWEDMIEKLHQNAIDKRKEENIVGKVIRKQELGKKAMELLRKLRMNWGI